MQIKLFLGTHTKQLEQEVNEWLKTLKASSVQIQTTNLIKQYAKFELTYTK